MGSLFRGALNAIKQVGLKSGERVLIIVERANVSVGRAIEKACMRKTNKIDFFVLEDFGKRPLVFVPRELLESCRRVDVVFFLPAHARAGKINERFTLRMPLTEIAVKNRARFAAMIGADEECLKQGMCVDYGKIRALSKKLFKVVSRAGTIFVSSLEGTFLSVKLSSNLKWVVADGFIGPGQWSNLPDGEVFTVPLRVDGVAVINGSMGDVFSKYGSLEKSPVYWVIEDSRVKSVFCPANKGLEAEFRALLLFDKNANKIGEFALGANFGVRRIIGNLLQDEKIVGVHLACGNPYPALTGAKWRSGIHCDGVILKPTVFVGEKLVMKHGKFVF